MGGRSRVEELFEQCYDDLLRYALRRVADPADAADVVAETWSVAWRRRAELPTGDQARLWLYGVARRVLANQRRGQLRRSALTERLRAELSATADTWAAPAGRVSRVLDRLRPADRDLLAMQFWEQLSPAEMAVVLDCSQAAVRVRSHRARARLRAALTCSQAPSPTCEVGPDGSTGGTR